MTFIIYPVNEILLKKVFKQNNLNLSRTIVVMTHGNSHLKSTCDVNLLSKLSNIFKEWRVMSNADRGGVIVFFVL